MSWALFGAVLVRRSLSGSIAMSVRTYITNVEASTTSAEVTNRLRMKVNI